MTFRPVIIVTGASRGLGSAIACWLAKTGAGLTLIARSGEKLGQTAETVRQLGGEPLIQKANVYGIKLQNSHEQIIFYNIPLLHCSITP